MNDPVHCERATVIVLPVPAQITRKISAQFPGWRIWHSSYADTWSARETTSGPASHRDCSG
jgi:hypothetical protein